MDAHAYDPPSSATTPAQRTERLDKALERTSAAPLRIGNKLALLQNGPDTYDDWIAAIRRAQKWVQLDNYIFQNDAVGRRFADALSEKAREGVTVRVLADWFGSWSTPHSFWREMRSAGVEVRPVNPPSLSAPLQMIRRDHRKLVAVDGEYASTGGVCIDEEWMERDPETGLPYRDEAVSVMGPAVADLEEAFAGVWDETGEPCPTRSVPGPRASRGPGRSKLGW